MKRDVYNLKNEKVSQLDLNKDIFDQEVRQDILARVIRWQLASRQQGTHKTKGISEISGTTKKPFRQKGTGNARLGSLRAPQCRGGATIFGPTPRSYAHSLPKKVRKLGLKIALSEKQKSGDLILIDSLDMKGAKTKEAKKVLEKLGAGSFLFIDEKTQGHSFGLAISNIIDADLLPQDGANVYDIIRREKLVMTVAAVKALEARL